uniref:Uncharacterized protein n=1 Tax=Anguilla anguilla TaxID=7936 RepID=A0A0E9UCX0_ANGAN
MLRTSSDRNRAVSEAKTRSAKPYQPTTHFQFHYALGLNLGAPVL